MITKQCYVLNTENKSFIDVAIQLKNEGVKNWIAPLIIYDKEIAAINPFDGHLSLKVKKRIIHECKENPIYFYREILRIRDKNGEPCKLDLTMQMWKLIWSNISNKDCVVSTAQMDESVTNQALSILTYRFLVSEEKSVFTLLSQSSETAYNLIRQFNTQIYLIPKFITSSRITKKSIFSLFKRKLNTHTFNKLGASSIQNIANLNIVYSKTIQDSKEKTISTLRGCRSNYLFIDNLCLSASEIKNYLIIPNNILINRGTKNHQIIWLTEEYPESLNEFSLESFDTERTDDNENEIKIVK